MNLEILRLIEDAPPEVRKILLRFAEWVEKEMGERLTRRDFEAFEKRFEAFAERTEENFQRVWEAINQLTQRLDQLTLRVDQLTQRVDQLTQRMDQLAEQVEKLTRGLGRTREELGGLSRTMAYALENEAYRHLPAFLQKRLGYEVVDRFVRTYLDGEEIDIFGKVRRDGEEMYLVGEAVLRLDDREKLRSVWRKVEIVKEEFGGEILPVIVTHMAHPEVLERARKAGILVVQSFEWA